MKEKSLDGNSKEKLEVKEVDFETCVEFALNPSGEFDKARTMLAFKKMGNLYTDKLEELFVTRKNAVEDSKRAALYQRLYIKTYKSSERLERRFDELIRQLKEKRPDLGIGEI